jgi:hypothetical protein
VPWPGADGPGFVNLHWAQLRSDGKKFWIGKPYKTYPEFMSMVHSFLMPKDVDIYFCTSRQKQSVTNKHGKPAALRNQGNVDALKSIWVDLDFKDYATPHEALKTFTDFRCSIGLPPPSFIVFSGNGAHIYWSFTHEISLHAWQPIANSLKNALIAHKVKCDTGCTVDSARILRVPGTLNHKTNPPHKVELIHSGEDYAVEEIAQILAPFAGATAQQTLSRSMVAASPAVNPVLRHLPPGGGLSFQRGLVMETGGEGLEPEPFRAPDLNADAIIDGCPFLAETMLTGGAKNGQPLWNLTTLAATFLPDGENIAHELSKGHTTYSQEDTQKLYERKQKEIAERNVRWPSCRAFENNGCTQCATCPHRGKIKSPLNLGLLAACAAGPSTSESTPSIDGAVQDGTVGVSRDDFSAYMPQHVYIFHPTREVWPASSVNARLGSATSTWLDQNSPVEQMTWAPGMPMLIPDRLIADGGWIERPGVSCLNLYRPAIIKPGNAAEAARWLDHIDKVYRGDAEHIKKWLAHRVQRPHEKLNHALVLGGGMGIGKDTLLEPVKYAVGPWNFIEVSPQQMLGRFNGFVKSVILRLSEARDLGDMNRFQFYDHTKSYIAAPPDVLRVDEKNIREHYVLNCCGVTITTNYKADGIYLPADDRRHYVAWSDLRKEDFGPNYWKNLWGWYENGGYEHVAAYLSELDISSFDPKAPPPKTAAFWDIVDANRAPEDAELADLLDKMKNPDAVTLSDLSILATGTLSDWINERKNRRAIPHRLETCGYVPVRNEAAKDRMWVISGSRQVVYAKKELAIADRLKAATNLVHRRTT